MKAIVIEQACKINVSRAKAYGELSYIFPTGASRSSIWSEEFMDEALTSLAAMEYQPRLDCIVLVGAVVPLTKIIARLVAIYGQIRVLCWSATERDYILQEVGNAPSRKRGL